MSEVNNNIDEDKIKIENPLKAIFVDTKVETNENVIKKDPDENRKMEFKKANQNIEERFEDLGVIYPDSLPDKKKKKKKKELEEQIKANSSIVNVKINEKSEMTINTDEKERE